VIRVLNHGCIFSDPSPVIGNPVNCMGVMGKGLALQFKQRYPAYYDLYRMACYRGELSTAGDVAVTTLGSAEKTILSIATKTHWKSRSDPRDIKRALGTIRSLIIANEWKRVSLPALGCGLGGLSFVDTEYLYLDAFKNLPCVVSIYCLDNKGEVG